MTLRDKELEDRIEEVGNRLTTPPSDTQQLLMLLDKTENLLSRVEQCPPQSMHAALHPSMKALTTKDLLRHSDLDVKIAVASCLSEITRITAPDAPYDDDLMKEIFGLIVGAFKNLDEIPSSSFSKRVSILETVAKVRSCVLMLDLECDDLILDMFFHFLKTIRPKHSETVFSSMETVMTLVIEESENISTGLLSCLLGYLKLDEKNVMSSSKKLAEKVLTNCALKLKPYLSEFLKGICAPPSEYSKIVAAVCQGNLGTIMQNETNTSGETQADNSKLSDRTLCDELPQGSGKQEQNAVLHEKSVVPENDVLPVKDVADADVSCKVATSNGAFQVGNGDSVALEQKAELSQPSDQLRDTGGSMLVASNNLGSGAEKLDSGLNISSRKGRKRKALGNLVSNEHNQYDKKEAAAVTGRRKSRSKHADLSQAGSISVKEVERTDGTRTGKKKKLEQNSGLADVTASVSLHTPKEDKVNLKKGRSRHSKSFGRRNSANKSVVDGLSSATGHRGFLENSQTTSADFPTTVPSSKKSEAINESERNLFKCSSSKRQTFVEDSITTPTSATCDSETKHQRQRSRSGSKKDPREIEFSDNKSGTGRKKKKGGGLLADVDDKEVKLKELVSSRKSMKKESSKEQNHLKDVYETESTRKLGLATQETFGVSKRRKNDKLLVGKKIRVWWPEDQKFYDGVVDSFDQHTKKHTIFYDDGDVEVLLLKEEKWEIIEAETNSDGVLENTTPDNASERKKKKVKGRQDDAASDKSETDPPLKRSSSSTIKIESIDKLSKRKGRPPGKTSDEMHKESSKRRGKSTKGRTDKSYKDNDQLTETANKLNNEVLGKKSRSDPPKSAADKIDNATPKSGDKVRLKTLKIRGKVKDDSGLSDDIGPKSRKKSGDSHDFRVKPKVNGSPIPHTREIPKNSGGRPAKGSSRKARGGVTPRIGKDLNSDDTSNKIDQPKKAGEAEEGRSTSGKKRKRGRFGK